MDFFSLKVIYPVHLFEAPALSQKVHDSSTYNYSKSVVPKINNYRLKCA